MPHEAKPYPHPFAERLVPLSDTAIRQLWTSEARTRRDEVRSGAVETIPGEEALERVRNSVAR